MANPYSVMTKEEEKSWLQRHPFFQGLLDSAAEAVSFPLRSPALPAQMMRAGMAAIGAAPEQSIKPPPEGSDAASPYALGRITADTAGLMLGARGGMPGAAARIENPYARQAGAINWHGTGARFNQFDDAFMGSGEGAQAFGWGHYTADRKGIAKDYFKKLSKTRGEGRVWLNGQQYKKGDDAAKYLLSTSNTSRLNDRTGAFVNELLDDWVSNPASFGSLPNDVIDGNTLRNMVRDMRQEYVYNQKQLGPAIRRAKYGAGRNAAIQSRFDSRENSRALRDLNKAITRADARVSVPDGSLMKVDIPDDEVARMLVQDKYMYEQPKNVQRAVRRLTYGNEADAPQNELARIMKAMSKEDRRALRDYINSPATQYGMAEQSTNPLFEAVDRATRKALPNRYSDRTGRVLVDGMLYDKGTRGSEVWRELLEQQKQAHGYHGASRATSQAMQAAGIPGMRFADGASRRTPNGPKATYNTISFDPRLIRILEINGEATGLKPWRPGEYQNMLLDAMRSAGR